VYTQDESNVLQVGCARLCFGPLPHDRRDRHARSAIATGLGQRERKVRGEWIQKVWVRLRSCCVGDLDNGWCGAKVGS
jgi:hypothetical protein